MRDLCANICVLRIPEGGKKDRNVFKEIMAEDVPNLKEDTDIQV